MYCYQCEQTAQGACTKVGVCGKTASTAELQDLLVHVLKGLSRAAILSAEQGRPVNVGRFVCSALFSTLTNVNFDDERLTELIREAASRRDQIVAGLAKDTNPGEAATFALAADVDGLAAQGRKYGIENDPELDADLKSLKQTIIYGLKGVAAYADHAAILGQESGEVYAYVLEALAATLDTTRDMGDLLSLALRCGETNLKVMELLDKANTGAYGHPVPTTVPLGHRRNKAILVSGHDLKDLADLLEATKDKGIDIYTHGEMLPCHGYPELKRHPHFFGHYGTAWQNQHKEFKDFPGAILMTTNCIQKPAGAYKDNIFTTGLVGWPGVAHVADKDFTPVIEKALAMDGFTDDTEAGSVMTGFARNAVLGVADKVIGAVKSGDIRHFFLVAGCDGAKPGRNYYTEFVEKAPKDTVILTLACGKFRFFDKDLGDINGIPRLLDIGQCNDAYSAIRIASALAEAFGCGVNDLPLSMVLSWYEQKAVAILLTLLHLGVKDIRLGPTLPAFLSPNVTEFLVKNYGIKPIGTPDGDLKAILG